MSAQADASTVGRAQLEALLRAEARGIEPPALATLFAVFDPARWGTALCLRACYVLPCETGMYRAPEVACEARPPGLAPTTCCALLASTQAHATPEVLTTRTLSVSAGSDILTNKVLLTLPLTVAAAACVPPLWCSPVRAGGGLMTWASSSRCACSCAVLGSSLGPLTLGAPARWVLAYRHVFFSQLASAVLY